MALEKQPLGNISVLYLTVMARAVRREGCDIAPLFRQFGISEAMLHAQDARISIPRFMRLGHAAIRLTGQPALGLIMGQMTRPVDAGLAGLAGMTAPTPGRGLATIIRYSLLTSRNSRGHPDYESSSRTASFYSIRPYNGFNFFVVDSVLAAWTQFLRDSSDRRDVLQSVMIEYADPGYGDQLQKWFGCPVTFSAPANALVIREDVAQAPSIQSQPAMHASLSEQCDSQLRRIHAGWSLADRVRERLTPLLNGTTPTLATVATALGISPWTLQRHLAAQDTGYRELLDETRRDLSADYVRETSLSYTEIAWLLGFSNPPAFHKAYKRWFGESPGRHRATLLNL